jgi:hypothetical protein
VSACPNPNSSFDADSARLYQQGLYLPDVRNGTIAEPFSIAAFTSAHIRINCVTAPRGTERDDVAGQVVRA